MILRVTTGQLLPLAIAIAAVGLASCAPFDVNVSTAEPIVVDLNMDVHVYQHGEDKIDEETVVAQTSYREAMDSRRDRMAEIQELKNGRVIGENHLGKLSIRNKPAGEYGNYTVETVEAENRDREFLIQYEAEEKGVPVSQIREEQWQHWLRKSFPGEWIEVEDGNNYRWEQKAGAE